MSEIVFKIKENPYYKFNDIEIKLAKQVFETTNQSGTFTEFLFYLDSIRDNFSINIINYLKKMKT